MKCKIKNHQTGEFECEKNIHGKIKKTNGKCEVFSGNKQGSINILGNGGGFGTSYKRIDCTDDIDIREAIRKKYPSENIEFQY